MANNIFPELYPGWNTVRRLGQGSYGTVYEIERDLFGKTEKAALKVISIPQSESDVEELYCSGYDEASITAHFRDYLADIVREYSLMAEMKGHTNIVYCDDIRYIQHDDGIGWDIYIKMELLKPLMKALPVNMNENEVAELGRDICRALVLCRNKKIIHRDIKPQNIFVSETGDYKLGDFGIAKTIEKTTGGTKIGTYSYMAPEVYNNQPYGGAADIYSLGMVMYWLLNERRLPFLPMPPAVPTSSETENARMRRLTGEPIPAPKNGSEELKRIVLKACAYDVNDRYHTADKMLADLEALSGTKSASGGFAATAQTPAQAPIPAEDAADKTVGVWRAPEKAVPGSGDEEKTVGVWDALEPAPAVPAPKKKMKGLFIGLIAAVLVVATAVCFFTIPRTERTEMENGRYEIVIKDFRGIILSDKVYNSDGSWTELEYDSDGNEVKRTYNSDEVLLYALEYDCNGNVINLIRYNPDGTIHDWHGYEYDSNGKKVRGILYNADGEVIGYMRNW